MSKFLFPIKTVSESNQSESWTTKYRRKKKQQSDFRIYWRIERRNHKIVLPATIIFTRYSCKTLDTDNLAGAMKHVQDALAKELGVDDGSPLITWKYQQEKIAKREHYFTVEIQSPGIL